MNDDLPPLDIDPIRRGTAHLALRPHLLYHPVVDSTNRILRDVPPEEWKSGTVAMTDFQEAGRGRQGRTWLAPPRSSLLFSVALEVPSGVAPGDGIMMMALAVADGIAAVTDLSPTIKWPNDVLLSGKKTCGILAEYDEEAGRRRLILGAGINVNFDPAEQGVVGATSLRKEAGRLVSREDLAVAVLSALDRWYGALLDGPDRVFDGWSGRLDTIGRDVTVFDATGSWRGKAIGVLRNGALRVRTSDGEVRTVYAADVSVRT